MTRTEAIKVIDGHAQKYLMSCSPSVVEMLLKLEGKVLPDYYDQQHKYQNQNVGLEVFREQEIKGLLFHQHDTNKDGSFADRIRAELSAGRFVGIYALNAGSTTDYHGWIAVEIKNDGQLILRSKNSEYGNAEGCRTLPNDSHHISRAVPPQITDCIYYTFPNSHSN